MSNIDLNQIYKELGLENEENKQPQPVYELIDPVSGKPVKFESAEEMNRAVKTMQEQYANRIAELEKAMTTKPEEKKEGNKPSTESPTGLSPEEQAVFAAISEKDPLKGVEFLFSKTGLYKEMNQKLEEYRRETEANKGNLVVAQFVSSRPELSAANPNKGQALAAVGQVLNQMLPPGATPTPQQLDLAMAAAKSYRPDLFNIPQAPIQQAAPVADPWGLPNSSLGQLYQQPQFNQTAQPSRPNNPPVPPSSGGGTGYGTLSEIQLLDAAFQKGGAEEAKRVMDRLIAAYGQQG